MAGAEADQKGLDRPHTKTGKPVEPRGLDADWAQQFLKALETGRLEQLKLVRDKLDQQVPKILSLGPIQRAGLSIDAKLIGGFCRDMRDKLAASSCRLSYALELDTTNVPPKKYEEFVLGLWKVTKRELDAVLDIPEAKQLLNPPKPLKK